MKTSRVRQRLRTLAHRIAPREHRRLSRSGYGFALADSIGQLNSAMWDAAVDGSSVFLSRPYLRVLEAHRPPNLEPRYALVTDGDTAIAAVACQVVTLDADRVGKKRPSPGVLSRALRPALHRLKGVLRERVLVCGNLLTWGQHAVAFSEAGRQNPERSWSAVAEALYRIRRAERISGGSDLSLIKDFASGGGPVPVLGSAGFRRIETEPNMALAIDPAWKNYDDYLAALDGKYRKSVRQIFKEIETGGALLEGCANIAPLADDFHRLYMAVQDNNALRPVSAPASYLAALGATFGDGVRTSVIRRDGKLLGFVVTLRDGDTAVGYHIGFDREAAESLPLYLRLLHAVVADAIDLKCRSLSLGRTALEPKARLGARPEPMEMWVKHRTGGLNFAIGTLLGSIEHAEAPERNPFKKTKV
jgi:hypothetical protein